MEQIIFLVGAIVLNLVLKSIQDKKKMEEARNKRISGNNSTTTRAESQPVMKKAKEPSLIQELITIFNEEIEKGKKTTKPQPSRDEDLLTCPEPSKPSRFDNEEWVGSQAKITESAYKDFSHEHYSRGGHRDLDEEARLEAERKSLERENLKKDILRGVIFSEILGKPKALKRSI